MPEVPVIDHAGLQVREGRSASAFHRSDQTVSFRALWRILVLQRRLALSILGALLLGCFLYCLIAPAEFEAQARIALRSSPASSLNIEGAEPRGPAEGLTPPMQTETVAGVLRSDRLAWTVILDQQLYRSPAFMGNFAHRFPGFRLESPDSRAQSYLLERFHDRLHVGTLPRSLLVEIRFRTRDPALSAAVVNALIAAYGRQQTELRRDATDQATRAIQSRLQDLKTRADSDDRKLAAFQKENGILISPETLSNGAGAAQHLSALVDVDELGRELAAAHSERLLREAEYHAAEHGDPEVVLAFDPRLSAGNDLSSEFRELHMRHTELDQELAQLSIERGPNFPRVLEIRKQLADLDREFETQNAKLRGQLRGAWTEAEDREQLVRRSLEQSVGEGRKVSDAAAAYEGMRREAEATRDLYVRMEDKLEEAGLAAGAAGPDIWVVDEARPPARPAAPDLPLYMAITLFAGIWIAVGVALLRESLRPSLVRTALLFLASLLAGISARAQAPTPSTSGLPTGVTRVPVPRDNRATPSPSEGPPPPVWNQGINTAAPPNGLANPSAPLAAPIQPGYLLDIGEFHTPEFHSIVRVSTAGTVKLPMLEEIRLEGMDELQAEHAIAAALIERGILNHPQVSVLITAYVGQDVSVLGEVVRPGLYPYTLHHRLFDLISAASGLSPTAGAVANIYHRNDPETPHPVELTAHAVQPGSDRNPELAPGDIVQVTRAGLVYVVGDVIRPGGFTVDPAQDLTVLKALSLAWGPSMNASLHALLIREQKDGGRSVVTLDLKRMLHGQDPDQPILDHDILYVPNSSAKSLYNHSIESALQSAAGVSIYSAMVYSQRY